MKMPVPIVSFVVGLAATVGIAQAPPPAGATSQAPAPTAGRGGGRGGPAIVSPQIESDGRVTFRILAPQATTVTVGGDINGSLVRDPAAPPAPVPSTAPVSPGPGGGRGGPAAVTMAK